MANDKPAPASASTPAPASDAARFSTLETHIKQLVESNGRIVEEHKATKDRLMALEQAATKNSEHLDLLDKRTENPGSVVLSAEQQDTLRRMDAIVATYFHNDAALAALPPVN